MRIKLLIAGAAVVAAMSTTACSAHSSSDAAATTPTSAAVSMPTSAPTTAKLTGDFAGLNGKMVAGTASIAGNTVTLTGYSSDQGPDLHLYLANGTTEAAVKAGVQISPVAYNKAMQTFTLPSGVNAGFYQNLVVHCDKALAVFGAAELSR
jgi:hypothetical protein